MSTKFWVGNRKERDHSEDLCFNEIIISEQILGNKFGGCGVDSSGYGWETVANSCEHNNEPSGSIKDNFLSTKESQ
jgi:hypothetical protein